MDKVTETELRRLEEGEKEPLLGKRTVELQEFEIMEGEVVEIFDPMSLVGLLLPISALGLLAFGFAISQPAPPS